MTRTLAAVLGVIALLPASAFAGASSSAPTHADLDALLQRYVTEDGVRYAAWKENAGDIAALDAYLTRMSDVRVSALKSEAARLAFWINLYNAVTLDLVLEGYPVKSIKDLGGLLSSPWEKDRITVEGEELTLNEIENEIIRKRFAEPRIHFALNCAAVSCPPLRIGAFTPEALDEQLEERTRTFLEDDRSNFVEDDGRLRLSKIFDWYREDFDAAAGSVPAYVQPYLPGFPDRAPDDVRWKATDYDWALNEAGDAR